MFFPLENTSSSSTNSRKRSASSAFDAQDCSFSNKQQPPPLKQAKTVEKVLVSNKPYSRIYATFKNNNMAKCKIVFDNDIMSFPDRACWREFKSKYPNTKIHVKWMVDDENAFSGTTSVDAILAALEGEVEIDKYHVATMTLVSRNTKTILDAQAFFENGLEKIRNGVTESMVFCHPQSGRVEGVLDTNLDGCYSLQDYLEGFQGLEICFLERCNKKDFAAFSAFMTNPVNKPLVGAAITRLSKKGIVAPNLLGEYLMNFWTPLVELLLRSSICDVDSVSTENEWYICHLIAQLREDGCF